METLRNLFTRFRHSGVLLLVGIFLIIYAALGFLYFQQGPKQEDLTTEINKFSLILSNPLPSAQELQTKYDEVTTALAPLPVPEVLEKIVNLARESGIDVDPESNKFSIPPPQKPTKQTVGGNSYQVQSFINITATDNYANITAFISALDSGEVLKTMVLKIVVITQTETEATATIDLDLYTKPEDESGE